MPDRNTIEHREFRAAATATDGGDGYSYRGIAVPWGQEIELYPGLFETIAPGACQPSGPVFAFWRHKEVIGKITAWEDTSDGWLVDAEISHTTAGDDAATLIRDGVITSQSIGFFPREWTTTKRDDGTELITYTAIDVRESSLVPIPAYDQTSVARRQHPDAATQEEHIMDPITRADLDAVQDELSAELDKLSRQMAAGQGPAKPPAGDPKWRTAGQILKAAAGGDQDAADQITAAHQRAFTGTTTDSEPWSESWVRDIDNLVTDTSILGRFFATGQLPAEGMTVDYTRILSDTTTVATQIAQGDTAPPGKVTLVSDSAAVQTWHGAGSLSWQAIQRSRVNQLDIQLKALAAAAGRKYAAAMRTAYDTVVATQKAAGASATVQIPLAPTWLDWIEALVEAAEHYADLGYPVEALIVGKADFLQLLSYTGADGRPMMSLDGSGANTVGRLDLSTTEISGRLASLPILLNIKQAASGAAFANSQAIRSYLSPLSRLQDDQVLNLTRDVAVYRYGAIADEIPGLIVPVVKA